MTEHLLPTLFLGIQTLLLVGLNIGVWEARNLRIERHRAWMTGIYFSEGLVLLFWMLPNALSNLDNWLENPLQLIIPWIHATLGIMTAILASILIIKFWTSELDLRIIRKYKRVMRAVYTTWTLGYVLGLLGYLFRFVIS